MRNTNTEIEYPFNLKIKTVFGLVSIVFHCIYSQTEEPTIKQTQWLWSNNTFLSPSLKCVITRLTPKCEWLPRTDTKLYTLPIFSTGEGGNERRGVGYGWALYQITAPLLCLLCATPHGMGKWLFLSAPCFPSGCARWAQMHSNNSLLCFDQRGHCSTSSCSRPGPSLSWDVPTFLLCEATQVIPAAFTHYRFLMSCCIRLKVPQLNKTPSRVYSTTT